MKRFTMISLAAAAVSCLLITGGCVPKAELDKALELNRKAQRQLRLEQAKVRQLEGRRSQDGSAAEMQKNAAMSARRDTARIQSMYDKLKIDYATLAEMYKQRTQAPAPPKPLIALLPAPVDKALKSFAAANPDLVEYNSAYGMVKIKSDLTFASGSTRVKSEAIVALKKLVQIANDPAISTFHLYIAGHTDNVPVSRAATRKRHPNNWYLSVHRAIAVEKKMVEAGLAAERVGVMGFGEYHPVDPNKSSSAGKPLGNKANRRVEIWIVPQNRFLTR